MAEVEIRVYGPETCGLCNGSGELAAVGLRPKKICMSCDGRGHFLGQETLWVQHIARGDARYCEVWKAETWESSAP